MADKQIRIDNVLYRRDGKPKPEAYILKVGRFNDWDCILFSNGFVYASRTLNAYYNGIWSTSNWTVNTPFEMQDAQYRVVGSVGNNGSLVDQHGCYSSSGGNDNKTKSSFSYTVKKLASNTYAVVIHLMLSGCIDLTKI